MALGKRKERSDESEADKPENPHLLTTPHESPHSSTLFVSNLPYNTTSTDLQTLFSDIAPVRNAFIVTEHGTGVSKGVGYVSFSIREDAIMAYDKIAKEGFTLVGRKLRIQWAEQKSKVKKEKTDEKEQYPQKKARPSSHPKANKSPHDPLAIRTIAISGLPGSIDSKALWKKVRKYEGAEKVEWPVVNTDGDGNSQDPSTAYAIFSTPSAAQDAIAKLHAHVFKGSLLSVTLKKRLDNLASQHSHKPTTTTSSTTGPSKSSSTATTIAAATPSHAIRLIVRNLPFTATESDLRSAFLPYGPIYTINMPLKDTADDGSAASNSTKDPTTTINPEEEEEGDKQSVTPAAAMSTQTQTTTKATNKGFAFVWYYYRKDAERAMEKCNGMLLRAGAAEKLVNGKQKRKKERRLERIALLTKEKGEGDVEVEDKGDEGDETKDEKKDFKADKNERVIAVDWALSKNRWEEAKAKIEEELNKAESEEASSGSDSADESGSDTGDDDDHDELGVHHKGDEEDVDEDEEEVERDEDDKPVKPQLPQTDIGTTLFIRNIPYDATEDELRTLFRLFGPLRYARITLDPDTGRSRGTGFACFWNKEDADRVVEQSELLKAETTGGNTVAIPKKKNPFTLPSILTPDPSSSLAQNLVLHGRALDVSRAVTRDEAGRLKEEGERAREKADKRNMYLLREGAILPSNPEAFSLSPADLERRTNSYNARRTLLKSNPSLYISKTRLSVRQIPVYVTDLMLKRLALHAARTFEKEVKQGKRSGLSTAELDDLGGQPGKTQEAEQEEAEAEVDESHDTSDAESQRTETTLSKSARRKAKFLRKPGLQRKAVVKQAKIVRQADRVDPITGKGKSRGYGFVEPYTHADALRVLRWTNNNPDVPLLLRYWWREELERLIKIEQDKLKKKGGKGKEGEDDKEEGEEAKEARLKRMMNELEKEKQWEEKRKPRSGAEADEDEKDDDRQGMKNDRRTLIVEFSIENIQVVQRRNTIQKNKAAVHKSKETEGKKMLDDGQQPSKQATGHRSRNSTTTSEFESQPRSFKTQGGKRVRENEHDKGSNEQHTLKERKQGQPEKKRRRLSAVDSSANKVAESVHRTGMLKEAGQKIGSIIGRKRKERKGKGTKRKGKA